MALKSIDTRKALLLFGVAYFGAAQLGLAFVIEPEKIASIWPVSGLALAVLMLAERKDAYKYTAVVFVANTLANLWGGNPLLPSLGFALANTAESAAGMWAFCRISGSAPDFTRMRDLAGLMAAAFLMNGLTAFLGAAVPFFAFGAPYWQTWKLWWVADGLGILLVAPCILTWANIGRILKGADIHRLLELLLMLLLVLAIGISVFGLVSPESRVVSRPYWLIGLIVWLAVRFESWGVMMALMMTALVSHFSIAASNGSFPWGAASQVEKIIQMQGYLMTTITIALSVACSMSERRLTAEVNRVFKESVDNSSDAVSFSTADGRHYFQNKAFSDLFGAVGERPSETVYVDKAVGREVFKTIMSGGKWAGEAKMYAKDGGVLDIFLRAYSNQDERGNITTLVVIHSDFTERKRQEEKLTQIMKAVESTSDAIGISDPLGRHIYQNKALGDLFGYATAEELEAAGGAGVVVKDPRVAKEMYDQIMGGKSWTGELDMVTKSGRVFPAFERADAIKDKEGNIIGLIGIITDMSALRETEMLLKESEERYQSLFDQAGDGIFILSTTGKIVAVNKSFATMHGFTADEILGMTLSDLDVEGMAHMDDRIRRVMNGETFSFEVEHYHKDGHIFPLEVTVNLVSSGKERLIVAVHRDLSERRRGEEERRVLEERLRHAEKMEAIGTLAGGIAHDFNNLLMGIQGYASLISLDLEPSHPDYERLKRIEEHVRSGADLTRQLLGFASGGQYDVKPADMNDILEKSASMFGRTKKEITIHGKYGKDLMAVEVDRGQMEQVFMNLYVNAWQAMPGGGEIFLETENAVLDNDRASRHAMKPGRYVKIMVSDTGTGMDEKTRVRIFDPFFTTKGMGRGTGLGLATVYGIIKGHGGMIDVESELGRGTRFTIHLPASEKTVVKEKGATGTVSKGTETILLVEDEKAVLEVSRELLEFLGYRVYAVGSGQEAIAVYLEKGKGIDLVVLDMVMPGISGGETFDRLREIDPHVRVLLASGYSIEGEAKTIMARGCNGFIQKPFRLEKISGKIREILG
jgi:PAS domain S-box-containing protein